VHSRDAFWEQKYGGSEEATDTGRMNLNPDPRRGRSIHLPPPSYFPLTAALGLVVMAIGMVLHQDYTAQSWFVVAAGIVVLAFSLFGWSFEPNH
jgi:hypothetical protein